MNTFDKTLLLSATSYTPEKYHFLFIFEELLINIFLDYSYQHLPTHQTESKKLEQVQNDKNLIGRLAEETDSCFYIHFYYCFCLSKHSFNGE